MDKKVKPCDSAAPTPPISKLQDSPDRRPPASGQNKSNPGINTRGRPAQRILQVWDRGRPGGAAKGFDFFVHLPSGAHRQSTQHVRMRRPWGFGVGGPAPVAVAVATAVAVAMAAEAMGDGRGMGVVYEMCHFVATPLLDNYSAISFAIR